MITFNKIKFRNFLSTGNNFTEINFLKDNTSLIIGTNGSGKSTLLDALCFVLFNKAFRKINKSQLVNSTNEKDCLVELEFSTLNSNWKVLRGIKPAIFEIHKDGVIIDQLASNNDQQEWLEKQVLKLNYKSFTQIVILGSASFIPFMQLNTTSRREIVEDLLDIKIFSTMNLILKQKIKYTNEKIKELEISHKMTNEKIQMQKQFIKNIELGKKEQIQQKEKKITEIKDSLIEVENNTEVLQNDITELNLKLKDFLNADKKIKQLSSLKIKLKEKISNQIEQKMFFESSLVCPSCTQNIDDKLRIEKIKHYDDRSNELKSGLSELQDSLLEEEKKRKKFIELSEKILDLNNQISKNNIEVNHLNKQKVELEKEIFTINNKNEGNEKYTLEKLQNDLNELEDIKYKNKKLFSYYDFAQNLLKDNGVKSKIIKKYLPIMNKLINKYLQMMDFYINFSFDEEFNENIKSPIYEDFSYESFSEGEKMRINLAILFTWRDIARMKNSMRTNLLILDEIFDSSLDGVGIDYFSKIIRYVIKDCNIFVISHKTDEMIDLFDRTIKFDKIKGFSKIVS